MNKIEIDLCGPEGNAFYLLAIARKLCQKIGIPFEPIQKDMMSFDYNHLLKTFELHFGEFVTILR
jgi:hypothetical protein